MNARFWQRGLFTLVLTSVLAACGGGGGGSGQVQSGGSPVATTPPTTQNSPPTIQGSQSSSAKTIVAGNSYQFTPTAVDPDGQPLTFSIANRPSWAQFDSSTGRLSGTPTTANVGSYAGITISVSDGIAAASLPAFSLTVTAPATTPPPAPPPPGNQPPTISGAPAQAVTVGMAYQFRPQASDPDGQSLTFSIANRPAWANFNAATGELSGTPGAADVGQTSNIVISVTDGEASASLAAFSITVADVQMGSATLRWTPPTMNEDGSPLTDLRGYRVYYGTSSNRMNTTLELPNPGLTTAVVENLAPATWYFTVRAYNDANVESASSNVASKTIL
jgi:hypothetical protein